jgi:hypothetical protein
LRIATNVSNTVNFEGMISDVQVWDAAWSASDVLYDYNNPEQLALNRGGTSLTESNLKLWYPMQDGHRGQQSFILDGSNLGVGEELISDGGFDTDVAGGTTGTYWSAPAGWEVTGGKAVHTPGAGSNNLSQSGSLLGIKSGVTYKISFDVAGSVPNVYCDLASSAAKQFSGEGRHTHYSTATADNMDLRFYTGAFNGTIDNVSIKPVNDKNHATTVFYGDELLTNDDANWDSTGAFTSWTYYDDTTNSGAGTLKQDGLSLIGGRSYSFTFVLENNNNMGIEIKSYDDSETFVSEATYAKGQSHTVTFTPSGDESGIMLNVDDSVDGACNITTASFSLKEVGTATGWTDADQQLDIPQTALQSYNQLAWFGDTGADTSTQYVTLKNDITTYRGETVSFWFVTDSDDEQVLVSGLLNCGSYGNPTINDGGNIGKITVATAKGDASSEVMTATTWNDGQWHHCVIVVEGDGTDTGTAVTSGNMNSFFSIYVDGAEQTLEADGGYRGTTDTLIGCRKLSGDYKYQVDGCITEVSTWSNEFTLAEVVELYNDGKALNAEDHSQYTNCLGYWRNNGLAAWTNIKASGTNDGVVTGFTETLLIPAGVDGSRDNQGFLMNRQRTTNSLNLPAQSNNAGSVVGTSYVKLAGRTTYDTDGSELSFCFWIKYNKTGTTQTIFGDSETRYNNNITIGDDGTALSIETNENDDNAIGTFTAMTHDTWYHFALITNGDGTIIIYKDGVTTGVTLAYESFDEDTIINQIGSSGTDYYPCVSQIDDILIYSDKLEAPEVLRNYNAGKRSHR